jgi:predicted RNA binding protein YcfA (HicA-like mRNA interferase family)
VPKVRDILRRLRQAGWREIRRRGSHRQLHHPDRPGTVTVAGSPSDDLPPGTYRSILRQAGMDEEQE